MLDFTRPITTRDGQKVRVLCNDRNNKRPLVTLVGINEDCFTYPLDGKFHLNDDSPYKLDLINTSLEQEGWAYQENSTGKLSGFVSSINYPLKCVGYTLRKVVIKVLD